MLLELNLKNYTIVDSITVSFTKGLNIITGETGTGKSIIVDAVNILLGDKTSSDIIKSGSEEAVIEGLFDLSNREDLLSNLRELGYDSDDSHLILKRIISKSGRGRVYINGSNANLKLLSNFTKDLIDIFSQHEHQSLLNPINHINYLDNFSKNVDLFSSYRVIYNQYINLKKELEELIIKSHNQKENEDYLKFQLNEIISLNLKKGEDIELENEERLLSNSEKISYSLNEVTKSIYDGDNSVQSSLNYCLKLIDDISHIDTKLMDLKGIISTTMLEIEEISYIVQEYSSKIEFNQDRLDELNNRISEISRIKKKYGDNIDEILIRAKEMEEELKNIQNIDDIIENKKHELSLIKSKLIKTADSLSESRKKAANNLVKRFSEESEHVGLKGAVIKTEFSEKEVSKDGKDKIIFLFSANPGENPKQLSSIASGGELSRIMLLFKEFLTDKESNSILIFDEADSGIGGIAAEAVGRKIKNLSSNNQVICITHLPQVAKFANTHFRVRKNTEANKTTVSIDQLIEDQKVEEISRMLAGGNISQKTKEAAKEMLANVN